MDRVEKLTARATDLMRKAWDARIVRDPTPERLRGEIYARAIFQALQEDVWAVPVRAAEHVVPSCDPGPAKAAPAPLALRWEQDGSLTTLVGLPDGLSAAVYAPLVADEAKLGAHADAARWRWCLTGEDARVIAADKFPGVETQVEAQQQLLDALAKHLVERVSTCMRTLDGMRTLDALQPERLAPLLPEAPAVPEVPVLVPGEPVEARGERMPPRAFRVGVRVVLTAEVEGTYYTSARALGAAREAVTAHLLYGWSPAVRAKPGTALTLLPVDMAELDCSVTTINGQKVEE